MSAVLISAALTIAFLVGRSWEKWFIRRTTNGHKRLCVNINEEMAAAIRNANARNDESTTATIRRAIALLSYREAERELREADDLSG